MTPEQQTTLDQLVAIRTNARETIKTHEDMLKGTTELILGLFQQLGLSRATARVGDRAYAVSQTARETRTLDRAKLIQLGVPVETIEAAEKVTVSVSVQTRALASTGEELQ